MKVQILGTGCARCRQLAENTEKAAADLGVAYEMEKITDIREIVKFGVMTTPALAVDGKVKFSGRVATPAEIQTILANCADETRS